MTMQPHSLADYLTKLSGTFYDKDAKCSRWEQFISEVMQGDEEFLLSKRQYAQLTGRDQGERDVIAYHLRHSFKPGEDVYTCALLAITQIKQISSLQQRNIY